MSAELSEGKKLKRQVRIYELGMTLVIFNHIGISFKLPGMKIGTTMSWSDAVDASSTPENVPSIYEGQPKAFLKAQAAAALKRAVKRADKKESQ